MEQSDPVVIGLLTELNDEAKILAGRVAEFNLATANFNVAGRKYAAVRDMVTEYMGVTPYDESVEWPSASTKANGGHVVTAYRFMHLNPGNAALLALKELKQPSTIDEIAEHLHHGGLNIVPRAVNASLMRTIGVKQVEDGKYQYEEEREDDGPPDNDPVDDLPF